MKRHCALLIGSVLLAVTIAGCDLLDPTNTENPDVLERDFLDFPNAMRSWLEGLDRQTAVALNDLIVPAEIASDNYVNTQTFFNQFMDRLLLDYTDDDIEDALLEIAQLREEAEFALEVVSVRDTATTNNQLAEAWFYKGIAHLYTGEWFHLAPADSAGPVVSSSEQFEIAAEAFRSAIDLTEIATNEAGYRLALARTYRNLGMRAEAREEAEAVLAIDPEFVRFARYDNVNGPSNIMQNALFDRGTFDDLQPLARLDFLDPKYFIGASPAPGDDEESDLAYLKAEEAYLIIAEAQLAAGNVSEAKATMTSLVDLVKDRRTAEIVDVSEGRTQRNPGSRPNTAGWAVAFSPQDTFHTGLVIPRREAVLVPVISGTAVTPELIDRLSGVEEVLEVLYRMRQEIFIAEGRRMYDLGIQWPVPQVEVINNPNIEDGSAATEGIVPDFLPPGAEFDEFASIDFDAKTATLRHNLNEVLAANRASPLVAPFF